MVFLNCTIKYTKTGKAMRAASEDYATARLMGIDVDRIVSFTFGLGAALAGAGGVLVGMYFNSIHPFMGVTVGLKAFCAAVVGGIGSSPGAMMGGIFLGVSEVLGVAAGVDTYKEAIAFALLIVVLLVKPPGMFGRPIQGRCSMEGITAYQPLLYSGSADDGGLYDSSPGSAPRSQVYRAVFLGHAAFLSIGAYTSALMSLHLSTPFLLNVLVGGLMAAFWGVLWYPSFKLTGDTGDHYFRLW